MSWIKKKNKVKRLTIFNYVLFYSLVIQLVLINLTLLFNLAKLIEYSRSSALKSLLCPLHGNYIVLGSNFLCLILSLDFV